MNEEDPKRPLPNSGAAADGPAADATPIDLPVHATAYEAPHEAPARHDHKTFEMRTVDVEAAKALDPRRAPTQRLRRPEASSAEVASLPDTTPMVEQPPRRRGLLIAAAVGALALVAVVAIAATRSTKPADTSATASITTVTEPAPAPTPTPTPESTAAPAPTPSPAVSAEPPASAPLPSATPPKPKPKSSAPSDPDRPFL